MLGKRIINSNNAAAGGACTTNNNDYPTTNVAYYKMSTAADEKGTYNGTATNVNFNVQGKFGNAANFNGSSSKITISNSSFLPQGNNSRSISCWIKTTGGSNDGVIGYGNAANSQAFFIYITSQNKLGIYSYFNNTDGNIVISNNTWNHVVATYDGTNCKLYVNKVLDFTTAKTLNTGNGEFRIGGVNWNNSGEFFSGNIDQVRIFSSALDATQVASLYNEVYCVPTIVPTDNFNTVLYAGNNGTQSITTGFKPDFSWLKSRTGSYDHNLIDSVRGDFFINTNRTSAQEAGYNGVVFGNNGFTVAAVGGTTSGEINVSGQNYVAWNWKAGGAPTATNSAGAGNVPTSGSVMIDGVASTAALAGSLAATKISANTAAGFSIVKYDGAGVSGSATTVGHGLNAVPELIIIKTYEIGLNASAWFVYTSMTGNTKEFYLNTTSGAVTDSNRWEATSPSSTVFTLGSSFSSFPSYYGGDTIAYCFHSVAGYSKIGSYTGNGSSTGPTIVTGFEPAWVMIKSSSSNDGGGGNWIIYDNKRSTTNPRNKRLYPDINIAEQTNSNYDLDFLSNGFQPKIAASSYGFNTSGVEYIYMAFAAT